MLYSVISCQIGFCIFFLGAHFQNINGANLNHYNINRYRRQTQNTSCPIQYFKCNSGECIPEENVCDGTVDCTDQSDEDNNCRTKISCNTPFLFQCKYGACISKNKKCNGKRDCRDNSDETLPECQSTTQKTVANACGITKFRCDSGQCIEDGDLCDGIGNCNDRSDETTKACRQLTCPPTTFKCKYGACINRRARCNGNQDCWDGSDEESCPTSPTPPTTTSTEGPTVPNVTPPITQGCQMPYNPQNGRYSVSGSNLQGVFKPGDIVPQYSFISLSCNIGYKAVPISLETNSTGSYCIGVWTPPPKTCAQMCSSLEERPSTRVKCRLNGIDLNNCMNPVEGTTARISCEPLYEQEGLQLNPTRLCSHGTWDYPITYCLPVCGEKRPKGVTNIVNGGDVTKGDYPWQVAVYNEKTEFICGGSIINTGIVLSAAHCFTIPDDGTQRPKENYHIVAGKYYRSYNDERDSQAQYSNIKSIHIPSRFRGGITFFESDIAVIILSTPFRLSPNVQPVCIDLDSEYDQPYLSTNGVVTGWGYTSEYMDAPDALKELSIPFIPYERCFDEVPKEFRKYVTFDKICGGYLDRATAVCGGDSGGPLAFPKISGLTERYFVRGIVSTSPATEELSCDSNQYGTFTSVARHVNFIRDLHTLHRVT